MAADPLVYLSQVLDLAESLIERVRPKQATLPTPCRSWDVEALMDRDPGTEIHRAEYVVFYAETEGAPKTRPLLWPELWRQLDREDRESEEAFSFREAFAS